MAESDEPVISEIHMETCPPHTACWCTRFCFFLPGEEQHPADAFATPQVAKADAEFEIDDEGDVMIPWRPARREHYMGIHHSLATPVSRCGEQVWMGSCLLSDFILCHQQLISGKTVVELGAGVGLVSITAAMFADQVLLTDGDKGVLQLASRNVAQNLSCLSQQDPHMRQQPDPPLSPGLQTGSRVCHHLRVRTLNWLQLCDTQLSSLPGEEILHLLNGPGCSTAGSTDTTDYAGHFVDECNQECIRDAGAPQQQQEDYGNQIDQPVPTQGAQQQQQQFEWQRDDLALLGTADIWLAADVIYNETLTDAFMRTVHQLMTWQRKQQHTGAVSGVCDSSSEVPRAGANDQPRSAVLFIAVEKRYNFTLRDLAARASAFEHFLTYVKVDESISSRQHQPSEVSLRQPDKQQQHRAATGGGRVEGSEQLFLGKRWQVGSIPQVLQYDRSGDLELWELALLD